MVLAADEETLQSKKDKGGALVVPVTMHKAINAIEEVHVNLIYFVYAKHTDRANNQMAASLNFWLE